MGAQGGILCSNLHEDESNTDYLFTKLCSIENLFLAWRKFVRGGKRGKVDVMAFERNLETNLFNLQAQLRKGVYQHGPYETFLVRDPKERVISKADVRDRIVHQALDNVLKFSFELVFVFDNYACRLGKGVHKASYRLRRMFQSASRSNTRSVYALKCDVRKFFDSVDHATILQLVERRVQSPGLMGLIRHILSSFEKLPSRGIPLGNVTSQLFANVYLHELDRFVKHELRQKYYIRYCDDFIILDHDRGRLIKLIPRLQKFLSEKLKLNLHPRKVSVRSWRQGIDFVGYVHKPWATVIRTKTKDRMLQKVNAKNLTSYLGVCKHADTFELRQTLYNIAALSGD